MYPFSYSLRGSLNFHEKQFIRLKDFSALVGRNVEYLNHYSEKTLEKTLGKDVE